jgi:hypothetical protein
MNEWITPTGIAEVAIRVKDSTDSPIGSGHDRVQNKCRDHCDESSISSISSYGEDVTMQATESTADDSSLRQERTTL